VSAALRLTAAIFLCSAVFAVAGIFALYVLAVSSFLSLTASLPGMANSIATSPDIAVIKKVCLVLVDAYQEERKNRLELPWLGLGSLIAMGTIGAAVSARLYVLLRRFETRNVSGGSLDVPRPGSPIGRLLSGSFAGTLELWKAFWLIYLPVPALLAVILSGGYKALEHSGLKGLLLTQLVVSSLIFSTVYLSFIAASVIVWRCSRNTSLRLWTYAARTVVVLMIVVPLVRMAVFWGRIL
jgi:hypothetical protein